MCSPAARFATLTRLPPATGTASRWCSPATAFQALIFDLGYVRNFLEKFPPFKNFMLYNTKPGAEKSAPPQYALRSVTVPPQTLCVYRASPRVTRDAIDKQRLKLVGSNKPVTRAAGRALRCSRSLVVRCRTQRRRGNLVHCDVGALGGLVYQRAVKSACRLSAAQTCQTTASSAQAASDVSLWGNDGPSEIITLQLLVLPASGP